MKYMFLGLLLFGSVLNAKERFDVVGSDYVNVSLNRIDGNGWQVLSVTPARPDGLLFIIKYEDNS